VRVGDREREAGDARDDEEEVEHLKLAGEAPGRRRD
jgi:hypothetical protein